MNLIHIAGHLGADPEVRFTSSGQKVTTLRVAVRVRKGGADDTIWYRVTIWGDQFEKMMPYLKKGSAIMVVGELQKPEIFKDREGNAQISMNVTALHLMFSPFGKGGEKSAEGASANPEAPAKADAAFQGFSSGAMAVDKNMKSELDDEIPF
jgi:single-strand DNA-binding protein